MELSVAISEQKAFQNIRLLMELLSLKIIYQDTRGLLLYMERTKRLFQLCSYERKKPELTSQSFSARSQEPSKSLKEMKRKAQKKYAMSFSKSSLRSQSHRR